MDSFITSQLRVVVLASLASISSVSYAEHHDIFFDNHTVPIVLSASKLPQLQTEAPASITIIDRALIEASGANQVAEIFRLVPGMQIGNARGNFPVVAYQGLTSEFPQGVQVVIDGSSVYSPVFGGVIWSTLPIAIEDIERIEIVRGPNNASFGANAFQGVINITTIHASQVKGLTTSFRVNNNQSERAFLRFADSHADGQLDYRISLASEKKEGYKNFTDNFSKDELSARVDLRVDTHNTLQFNFSALDSKRQTKNPLPEDIPFDPKRNRNESSHFAQMTWEHQTNNEQQVNTHLSFHHFDGKDKYDVALETLDATSESTTWIFDVEHILKLNNTHRLVWGLGATHESVYAPFRINSTSTKTNTRFRVFGNLESKLTSKLYLNTGALVEHEQISGANVSPRVTLNYLSSPNHAYRLTATKAFRTPVVTEDERNIVLLGAPLQISAGHLKPETVTSFEAGYHGIYWSNSFNADLKLFQNHYKQLINNDLSNSLPLLDNLDKAKTYGAELELNYRPNRKNIFHAGYAYTQVKQSTDNRLNKSTPKHNFNLLFSHQYSNGWRSGVEYYYMSDMQYLGGQNDPQETFQRLDLSTGKLLKLANNQSIDISLDIELALNKNNDLHEQAVADNLVYLKVEYRVN
jgi:iron complex outermembrane receptor protein